MFSDAVIYGAAHVAYCSAFASEADERDVAFPGGENLCKYVSPLTPAEHDPIIRPLLAKIDKALGAPLDKIFAAGGIVSEEAQIDALSDLLLGVQGHGVSITDNYREQWEKGCEACRSQGDLPYDEMDGVRDLANEKLDAAGYPPEGKRAKKWTPRMSRSSPRPFAGTAGKSRRCTPLPPPAKCNRKSIGWRCWRRSPIASSTPNRVT